MHRSEQIYLTCNAFISWQPLCFFSPKSIQLAIVSFWRVLEQKRKEEVVSLSVRGIDRVFLCWVSPTADRWWLNPFPMTLEHLCQSDPVSSGCEGARNPSATSDLKGDCYTPPKIRTVLSSLTHSAWLQIHSCIKRLPHLTVTLWNLSDWCEKGWKGCFVEAGFARLLIWNINNWSSFFSSDGLREMRMYAN